MNEISDVFAFALDNPDYLTEFLSDRELPAELSEEERTALEAAERHIEEGVVGLLKTTAAAVATSTGANLTNHRRLSLVAKRSATVKLPRGTSEKLYGIDVALEPSGGKTQLVVRLVAKKGHQDKIVEALADKGVGYNVVGYHIAGSGIDLKEGDEFGHLAATIAATAKQLCDCV